MRTLPLLLLPVLAALLLAGCDGAASSGRPDGAAPDDPRAQIVADCLAAHPDQAKTRVLVLGFDGADFDILDPMIEAGELPNFARVKKEGAWGKLATITPMLSPIIWTTIATGKTPPVHGVLDFVVENPETKETISVSGRARMVEAFWDIAGTYGAKVGVVGWLCSWPAEPVNGFMVTDRFGLLGYEYGRREDEKRARAVYPDDLHEKLAPLERKVGDITYDEVRKFLNVSEEEFRKAYTRAPQPGNPIGNFRLLLATSETFRRASLELWKTEKPRVMGTYFEFFDATCHHFMPFAPPKMEQVSEEDYEKYKGAIAETCRYTDRVLGEFLAEADENTVILVVSDHGFRSGKQRLKEGAAFHERAAAQWHRRFGVFMAWGKGVRPGAKIAGISVYDITPTILGLMGYPSAKDMYGSFISEAFTTKPPETTVDTYERGRRERMGPPEEPGEGDDILLRKWETMGYLSGGAKTTSAHMNLGAFYLSENKIDKALEEFQAALLKDQSSARVHMSLGEVYQLKREWVKAANAFRTAARLDPGMVSAKIKLALMLKVLGKPEAAMKIAAEALKTEPQNPEAHLHVALLLLDLGDPKKGEAHLRKAIEIEPDFPIARNQLGILLLNQNKFAEAEEQFRKVLELEPGFLKAWNNLGVTLHRTALVTRDPQRQEEAFDKAVETYNEIIKRFPDYPKAWFNRAVIRNLRRQKDLALADVRKALELEPDYPEAKQLLEMIQAN